MPRVNAKRPALKKPVRKKMRKFVVRFEGEVEIEIDDALLKSCNTDDWREQMYHYTRDEQFVEHLARCVVLGSLKLESIDGFADQPEERVVVKERHPFDVSWDIDVTEVMS